MESANRAEAQRCVDLAKDSVRALQFAKAERYCEKALRMCPGESEAQRLLQTVREQIASGRAPVVSDSPSQQPAAGRAAPAAAAAPQGAGGGGAAAAAAPGAPPPAAAPAAAASGPPPLPPGGIPSDCPHRFLAPVYRWLQRRGIVHGYRTKVLVVWTLVLIAVAGRLLRPDPWAADGQQQQQQQQQRRAAPERSQTAEGRGDRGWGPGRAYGMEDSSGLSFTSGLLPGDITYSGEGTYFFMPLASMMVLPIVLQFAQRVLAG
eukprot:TRINITY_DN4704_c0_g2_i2.p1 TRINITY_DN4704_c0_g2~~TRINITY_DN4704_c0_g2_i2.p1  ORF type:complete len:263 (+),score=80.40 TRINITY_DN4704_c0_g2_i2:61-849(+)